MATFFMEKKCNDGGRRSCTGGYYRRQPRTTYTLPCRHMADPAMVSAFAERERVVEEVITDKQLVC